MKKVICAIVATAALLLAAPLSSHANGKRAHVFPAHGHRHHGFHRHHHHHHGFAHVRHHRHPAFSAHVVIGAPVWGPRYWYGPRFWYGYPAPYYVYPPPVVVERQAPVYVEQSPVYTNQEPAYWYYCESARAYYPYVQQCPTGWLKVVPQVPPAAPPASAPPGAMPPA